MKVKIVRKVITYVDDVVDMTPREYCELRADTSSLRVGYNGNVSIEVERIQPYSHEDAKELQEFFGKKLDRI